MFNVQFTVRDFRPTDFDTLWGIDQSCFARGIAYSRHELQTYMRRAGAFTLVAESDSRASEDPASAILGFTVAESHRGIGHIITIDVRAEARRHHVGSTLLNSAEHHLRAAQCGTVRLETAVDNTSALCFYKRHDYDVINVLRHYYSTGVDALLLEKNLLSARPSS